MTEENYRKAFEQAKVDLADAMSRKVKAEIEAAQADQDTVQLRRAVTALAALCGENVEDSMGLTEAVRTLFQISTDWFSQKEVREQIEALGVGLSDLKNPDASVFSVLNRLAASQELQVGTRKSKTPGGQTTSFKVWRTPPAPTNEPALEDDDIPF